MEDNNDMPSASALETHPIGETGGEVSAIFRDSSNITQGGPPKSELQNKVSSFSQSDTHSRAVCIIHLFGDSVASGPGNLQMAKKVVVTKGKFKDYMDEIQQTYEIGFTDYTRINMAYMLPPFVSMMRLYMYWIMFPRCMLAIGYK